MDKVLICRAEIAGNGQLNLSYWHKMSNFGIIFAEQIKTQTA